MSVRITDVDKGFKAVVARLEGHPFVRVSIDEALMDLAIIHEFGAPAAHIPQRSFFRATIDANADKIKALLLKGATDVFLGKRNSDEVLGALGEFVVGKMQATIRSRIAPPNAPSTLKQKNGDVPLIDEGDLFDAIEYQVFAK